MSASAEGTRFMFSSACSMSRKLSKSPGLLGSAVLTRKGSSVVEVAEAAEVAAV